MILLNNWSEIEALMQPDDALIWEHNTYESYTEVEAFNFFIDAMSEDVIPHVDDRMFENLNGVRNDGFKPEAWALIENSLKGKTLTKYRKNQKMYSNYCRDACFDPVRESLLCNFFHDSLVDKKISPGSVWSVYSCINHLFAKRYSINLNTYRQLRILLKAVTKWYVPKKADIISTENVMKLFSNLDIDDPFQLQTLVWSLLCYYSLVP